MQHYGLSSLSSFLSSSDFKLSKFAPFIHGGNILPIVDALEKSAYHLERNGNAQMIFTDLSFKLTRLLHQKAA
jgi:DNA polymerase-3 subunit delta'